MHTIITEKIPSGKLVRIKIDFDKTINKIQITGDFFLHPEDTIEKLEKSLKGIDVSAAPQLFEQKLSETLLKNNAELIGVTAADLARIIHQAVNQK